MRTTVTRGQNVNANIVSRNHGRTVHMKTYEK